MAVEIPGEPGELFASFARHLRALGRSPRTIESYEESFARVIAYTKVTEIKDLTPDLMRRWLVKEQEQTSPGSVGVRYRSARAFLRWLVKEGELDRSPLDAIPHPKQVDGPVAVLELDDLRKLIAQTSGNDWRDKRDKALLMFMLDSGARRGEVTGLQLRDLDLDRGEALITGKTGTRRIALGTASVAALDRWVRARRKLNPRHDAVWLGDRGPLSDEGVRQILKRLGRQAGIGNVNPHQLRHTWSHLMRVAGMGDSEMMELGGWKSSAMLAKYGRSAVGARARDQARKVAPGDSL
jgi:site-specific recombinase XerC